MARYRLGRTFRFLLGVALACFLSMPIAGLAQSSSNVGDAFNTCLTTTNPLLRAACDNPVTKYVFPAAQSAGRAAADAGRSATEAVGDAARDAFCAANPGLSICGGPNPYLLSPFDYVFNSGSISQNAQGKYVFSGKGFFWQKSNIPERCQDGQEDFYYEFDSPAQTFSTSIQGAFQRDWIRQYTRDYFEPCSGLVVVAGPAAGWADLPQAIRDQLLASGGLNGVFSPGALSGVAAGDAVENPGPIVEFGPGPDGVYGTPDDTANVYPSGTYQFPTAPGTAGTHTPGAGTGSGSGSSAGSSVDDGTGSAAGTSASNTLNGNASKVAADCSGAGLGVAASGTANGTGSSSGGSAAGTAGGPGANIAINISPSSCFVTPTNFLAYASNKLKTKFPFDIFGDLTNPQLINDCPTYRFFNYDFELCPLRDFLSILKWPVIIGFMVWSYQQI